MVFSFILGRGISFPVFLPSKMMVLSSGTHSSARVFCSLFLIFLFGYTLLDSCYWGRFVWTQGWGVSFFFLPHLFFILSFA